MKQEWRGWPNGKETKIRTQKKDSGRNENELKEEG